MADPPPMLSYADTATPDGVDGLQVIAVHDDVRRIVVPPAGFGRSTVAFEVTPFALRLTIRGPFGTDRAAWPRSALTELRVNRIENQLVLKLVGRDPVGVTVAANVVATEAVMHELTAALTAVLPAPPDRQVVAADPLAGLPASPARSALTAAAAVLGVGGLVLLWAWPWLGCPMVIVAAAAAGIALGSQRKHWS